MRRSSAALSRNCSASVAAAAHDERCRGKSTREELGGERVLGGGGKGTGIDPERIAHEADGQRDPVVERAR